MDPWAFRISGHLGVVFNDGVTKFDEELRMAERNTSTVKTWVVTKDQYTEKNNTPWEKNPFPPGIIHALPLKQRHCILKLKTYGKHCSTE